MKNTFKTTNHTNALEANTKAMLQAAASNQILLDACLECAESELRLAESTRRLAEALRKLSVII